MYSSVSTKLVNRPLHPPPSPSPVPSLPFPLLPAPLLPSPCRSLLGFTTLKNVLNEKTDLTHSFSFIEGIRVFVLK